MRDPFWYDESHDCADPVSYTHLDVYKRQVLPFILRAVTLAGIDSVQTPIALRQSAWERLARDLDLDLLDSLTHTVPLDGVIEAAHQLMDNKTHGRIVVDVRA